MSHLARQVLRCCLILSLLLQAWGAPAHARMRADSAPQQVAQMLVEAVVEAPFDCPGHKHIADSGQVSTPSPDRPHDCGHGDCRCCPCGLALQPVLPCPAGPALRVALSTPMLQAAPATLPPTRFPPPLRPPIA